ncbi:NAD(P)-binding domain-containing protein [Arthrobacter globiformis]|uniref:NAD(P)-binding domain-containing protein n=1 Tax=Arthrobacter globiformis TaxID=1665 RepID=UPI000B41FE15|nr:NAD(P)-binding domain-containing protein [Arthrobacter globiformis]
MTSYGVLGVGSIATAIVTGLCDGAAEPPSTMLSPRNAERAAELAARFPSVRVATDNQQVVDRSDVVVVCLLPSHAAEVLAGLQFRADHAVVSAIAGFPVGQLAGLVAPATDIARSIPLPAVATRGSLTPVHPATPAATGLYDRLGGSMEIDDELAFESVSAASGTVAAYFRYLGTIAGWLSDRGVPSAAARRYVADTFAALSGELESPGADFAALAQAHTTPGGLNEQFARHLEAAGTYDAVQTGLDAVLARITRR